MSWTIAHLTDDPNLGGVNKIVDQLLALKDFGEGEGVEQKKTLVNCETTWPDLPGYADHFILHFTISWRKLPFVMALRLRYPRARITLLEHSYTRGFAQLHIQNEARFARLYGFVAGFCNEIVAISRDQRDWLAGLHSAIPAKLKLISQACDVRPLWDIPIAKHQLAKPPQLLGLGRFHPQKGFDTLIKAVRELPVNHVELKLVGYGEQEGLLKALADGAPYIKFFPASQNIKNFYADCDLVCIPSNWEAFGLVMLEAKAAGRTVICSEIDGLLDQADPSWAFTHLPADILSLKQAILKAQDADLRQMGLAGREDSRLAFDRWVQAWQALLAPPSILPKNSRFTMRNAN